MGRLRRVERPRCVRKKMIQRTVVEVEMKVQKKKVNEIDNATKPSKAGEVS